MLGIGETEGHSEQREDVGIIKEADTRRVRGRREQGEEAGVAMTAPAVTWVFGQDL